MTTMDDFEFDSQSFIEYLEPSFASLFTLLREAKECHTKVKIIFVKISYDSYSYVTPFGHADIVSFHNFFCYCFVLQMNVLYIMGMIIDKMSILILPYADKLIQYLPMLWDESRDHNLLRCAIISILVSNE